MSVYVGSQVGGEDEEIVWEGKWVEKIVCVSIYVCVCVCVYLYVRKQAFNLHHELRQMNNAKPSARQRKRKEKKERG